MCTMTKEDQIALEEFRQLELIIGRQDELKAKTKSLAITLFSALTVAFISKNLIAINWHEYFFLSFIIALLFLIIETVYGATEINAEKRVLEIESCLRGECEYSGPKICGSLVVKYDYQQFRQAVIRERTYYFYVALLIIASIVVVGSIISPGQSDSTGTPKSATDQCILSKKSINMI